MGTVATMRRSSRAFPPRPSVDIDERRRDGLGIGVTARSI
jgi:hypothetical protein